MNKRKNPIKVSKFQQRRAHAHRIYNAIFFSRNLLINFFSRFIVILFIIIVLLLFIKYICRSTLYFYLFFLIINKKICDLIVSTLMKDFHFSVLSAACISESESNSKSNTLQLKMKQKNKLIYLNYQWNYTKIYFVYLRYKTYRSRVCASARARSRKNINQKISIRLFNTLKLIYHFFSSHSLSLFFSILYLQNTFTYSWF